VVYVREHGNLLPTVSATPSQSPLFASHPPPSPFTLLLLSCILTLTHVLMYTLLFVSTSRLRGTSIFSGHARPIPLFRNHCPISQLKRLDDICYMHSDKQQVMDVHIADGRYSRLPIEGNGEECPRPHGLTPAYRGSVACSYTATNRALT